MIVGGLLTIPELPDKHSMTQNGSLSVYKQKIGRSTLMPPSYAQLITTPSYAGNRIKSRTVDECA